MQSPIMLLCYCTEGRNGIPVGSEILACHGDKEVFYMVCTVTCHANVTKECPCIVIEVCLGYGRTNGGTNRKGHLQLSQRLENGVSGCNRGKTAISVPSSGNKQRAPTCLIRTCWVTRTRLLGERHLKFFKFTTARGRTMVRLG